MTEKSRNESEYWYVPSVKPQTKLCVLNFPDSKEQIFGLISKLKGKEVSPCTQMHCLILIRLDILLKLAHEFLRLTSIHESSIYRF